MHYLKIKAICCIHTQALGFFRQGRNRESLQNTSEKKLKVDMILTSN